VQKYQFTVDGINAAPVRDTINEAARDALDAGYACPDRFGRIVLHDAAEIAVLAPKSPTVH
jgi:hypothetical protein